MATVTRFGVATVAVISPNVPLTASVCVLPTATNAACGLTVIGTGVGVGVGEGDADGVSLPLGEGDGDADASGVISGCANGVAVGSGVVCARTEAAPQKAAPLRIATIAMNRRSKIRRFSPLLPEIPPRPGVFCSRRSGRAR